MLPWYRPSYECGTGYMYSPYYRPRCRIPSESPKQRAERLREEFRAFVQRLTEDFRRLFLKGGKPARLPVTWMRPVWRLIAPGIAPATLALLNIRDGRPMKRDFIGPRLKRKEPAPCWF